MLVLNSWVLSDFCKNGWYLSLLMVRWNMSLFSKQMCLSKTSCSVSESRLPNWNCQGWSCKEGWQSHGWWPNYMPFTGLLQALLTGSLPPAISFLMPNHATSQLYSSFANILITLLHKQLLLGFCCFAKLYAGFWEADQNRCSGLTLGSTPFSLPKSFFLVANSHRQYA